MKFANKNNESRGRNMLHQLKYLVLVSMGYLTVGCNFSARNTLDEASSEANLAKTQTRFICADHVIPRDDQLEEIENISIPYGEKVTFLLKGKKGTGALSDYFFANVQLKDGKTAWISSKFLKVLPCEDEQAGAVPGSVLAFTSEAPGILAMLDAIAYAEFRFNPESTNSDAYKTIFSYAKFSSFSGHPRRFHCNQGRCSDASGRYQFLSSTWDSSQKYISLNKVPEIPWLKGALPDFSPESQDKMAIYLLWFRYSYVPLKNLVSGDNYTLSSITTKLAVEWASLPGSIHNQGTLDWNSFKTYYWSRYQLYSKN
jgi:muramidase (phage lysozyme)